MGDDAPTNAAVGHHFTTLEGGGVQPNALSPPLSAHAIATQSHIERKPVTSAMLRHNLFRREINYRKRASAARGPSFPPAAHAPAARRRATAPAWKSCRNRGFREIPILMNSPPRARSSRPYACAHAQRPCCAFGCSARRTAAVHFLISEYQGTSGRLDTRAGNCYTEDIATGCATGGAHDGASALR